MSVRVHITPVSGNRKVGPIPVTTTEEKTCPGVCPLKGTGCYASSGPLGMHWEKVSKGERGGSWDDLVAFVRALPVGQAWRHNQAGDLPGVGNRIARKALLELAEASSHARGWTYTHKPPTDANVEAVRAANRPGFVVNLSANNLHHADELSEYGLPVVAVVPSDAPPIGETPGGRRYVVCPAQTRDLACVDCMLCAKPNRAPIVAFRAHGAAYRKAERSTGNA